jgi:hypothetical protein
MGYDTVRSVRVGVAGVLLAAISVTCAAEAGAQEPTDSLRAEVERLSALLDSLAGEVAALREGGAAEEPTSALERLRAAAAAAAAAGGEPAADAAPEQEAFVSRGRGLQALNPEISVNADIFAHLDPDDASADNFIPREFELSLISSLDPYSRAKIFIAHHAHGPEVAPFASPADEEEGEEGHGSEVAIEEGYVEWVGLPGGVGLKVGKFQQRFGTLNRWHSHALAFQSRSLPHLAFIGEEALAQTGASISWLAPFGGGAAGTYEATFEITRSENETLFGESHDPSALAHLNGFWQLGSSVDLDLGLSWLHGEFGSPLASFDRNAYNAEFSFNWVPPARARRAGLNVRGGVMLIDGLGLGPVSDDSAMGFWSMAEWRLSQRWLVGARVDRTENPLAPDQTQWLMSPTLTWWQSEFVRIRGEYDLLGGVDGGDDSGMFLLQITFAMGPHRHATY